MGEYLWDIIGISLGYLWDIFGTSLGYLRDIFCRSVPPEFLRSFFRVCPLLRCLFTGSEATGFSRPRSALAFHLSRKRFLVCQLQDCFCHMSLMRIRPPTPACQTLPHLQLFSLWSQKTTFDLRW